MNDQMTGASSPMPKYRCHKEVWALKIREVKTDGAGSTSLVPADARYAPLSVDEAWLAKHLPQAGGYYVVYADGYASFSPGEAFEEGYSAID